MKKFQVDCAEVHRDINHCNYTDYMKFAECRVTGIAADNSIEEIYNKKDKYSITADIKNDDTIFDNDNNALK